jgi:glycine dehydrogenase subunit 1
LKSLKIQDRFRVIIRKSEAIFLKYYPHTSGDVERMLKTIGVETVDELFSDIPQDKKIGKLNLPSPRSEMEVVQILNNLSDKNSAFYKKPNFLGAGTYRHFSPSVVDAVMLRSEFYTAYTPYQAEASQGVLQSIFEFQTLICMLTGMDASNASLYDGATACAEAATLAIGHTRKTEILYSQGLHPEYVEVMKTYFRHTDDIVLTEIPLKNSETDTEALRNMVSDNTAGIIIQNPNCLGFIENTVKTGNVIKEINKNTLFIIAVNELHSLGVLKSPGECGADVAIGDAASMGLPPSYGGPHLGFMATTTKYLRKMPGRLVGQTVDENGKRAFCLTLQAREQHIRREKAASNICTNQALCALAASVYLSHIGKKGLAELAALNMAKAQYLKNRLMNLPGFEMIEDRPFFNEFTVKCPDDPVRINRFLYEKGIVGGFNTGKWRSEWKNHMTFCATEMNSKKDIDDLAGFLETYCREEVGSTCTIA